MKRIEASRYYRLPEAAALLPSERIADSMHPQTLRQLIRTGRIEAHRGPSGRYWRVRGSELIRYLALLDPHPCRTIETSAEDIAALRAMGFKSV